MTQAEKANRYDEVVNKLKRFIAQGVNPLITRADIQDFFPELTKSEDEKNIKDLIDELKCSLRAANCQNDACRGGHEKRIALLEWAIAWLEKQGEQKEYTFKSLPRLLEMVEPTERAKVYCQKLIDTLVKEGYFTDAKIVGECLKQMNGEKVALATMDNQKINKSEDEMIIKELISFVSNDGWKFTKLTKEEKESWIAWLKKQCQKSTSEIIKEYFANTSKEQLDKDWEELKHLNDVGITIEECNETKFHEGDWIVNNNSGGVCQVTEIRDDEYCLWPLDAEIMGYLRIIDVDNDYHLWTIEDTKDGDILFQDLMDGKTFIFNGINSDMAILYSFIINNDSKDVLSYDIGKPNTGIGTIKENKNIIHPATKEQRDLLFKKMHDAGYVWNVKEKELKKIEKQGKQKKSYDVCDSSMMDNKKSPYGEKRDFGYFEEKPADKVEPKFNKKKELKKIVPIFYIGDTIAKKHNSDINKFGQFTITDVSNGKYWYDESIICDITEQDDWELVEQKPADKIESQFHEDDWITNGQLTCKILGVIGKSYELHLYNDDYCHFETDIQSVDKDYHLWSIRDAKDGDILVSKHNQPFIYNGIFDEESVGAYCGIDKLGDEFLKGIFSCDWSYKEGVKPATKEKCIFLFSKMKDAGYEFNFEKKELKKIEQKFTPMSLDEAIKHCEEKSCGNNACALEHKQLKKWLTELKELKKQKPAWSEEDEKMVNDIIAAIDTLYYHGMVNWLKSLKDRVQPRNRWKPSKEQIISLIWVLNNIPYNKHKEEISGLLDQMRNIFNENKDKSL